MKQRAKKRKRNRIGSLFLFFLMLLSLAVFTDVPAVQASDLPTITVTEGVPASGQLEAHGPVREIFQWSYDGETFNLTSVTGAVALYGLSYGEFEEQLWVNEIAYLEIISATDADIPDYADLDRDVEQPGYRDPDREIWEPDRDPTVIDDDDIVWGDPETQFGILHVYDAGGSLNPAQFQTLASPQLLPSTYQANSIVNTDYFAMPIPGYIYDPGLPGNGFIQLSADMPYVFVFYIPEAEATGPLPPQPPPPPATQTGDPGFASPKPPPKPQGPAIDQLPAGTAPPSPQGVDNSNVLEWWEEEGGSPGISSRPDRGKKAKDVDEPDEPEEFEELTSAIMLDWRAVTVLYIDSETDNTEATLMLNIELGSVFTREFFWGMRSTAGVDDSWSLDESRTADSFPITAETEEIPIYMLRPDPEEDENRMVIFH